MSNKDMLTDADFVKRMAENNKQKLQDLRRQEFKELMIAALQGLCSADPSWQNIDETASKAAAIAEAALAELEGRDG